MLRPENLTVSRTEGQAVSQMSNSFTAEARQIVYLGSCLRVLAELPDGTMVQASVSDVRSANINAGDKLQISWSPEDVVVLPH